VRAILFDRRCAASCRSTGEQPAAKLLAAVGTARVALCVLGGRQGTHQNTSARQYITSSLDSRGWIVDDPSDRTISTSVERFADTIVTCGGAKP